MICLGLAQMAGANDGAKVGGDNILEQIKVSKKKLEEKRTCLFLLGNKT